MPIVKRPVTQEALEEALSYVGKPVDRSRQRWNTAATADAIRHFAVGVGDPNPLWIDPAYAGNSKFGTLLAPPTFVLSVDSSAVIPGLHGLARLGGSLDIEWFERIRLGDQLVSSAECMSAELVDGEPGKTVIEHGKVIIQAGLTTYRNQTNTVVAIAKSETLRTARQGVDGAWAHEPRNYRYTPDKLEEIRRSVLAEVVRGDVARYYQDVSIGEVIGPITKGPFTLSDLIAWYAGAGPHGRLPHRMFWKELTDRPDFYSLRPELGIYEYSERGHYDMFMARDCGMPGPYDNPMFRTAMIAHLFTDWMGDAGFLKSISCRFIAPYVLGDTMTITATITSMEPTAESAGLVRLQLQTSNQLDELTTTGSASVILPNRG